MIFLVRTIKQIDEQTAIPTDFVIQAENEEQIKHIMNDAKVIVVGITVVPGWPKSGRIFAQIEYEGLTITCCIAAETVEQACERIVLLGLPITAIQTSDKSISPELSQQLIATYQNRSIDQTTETRKRAEAQDNETYQHISAEKLARITTIISQTINDIELIETKFGQKENYKEEVRQLHTIKEQLTKMKLGSNIEKSTLILEQAFSLMEKVEISEITTMKEEEQKVISTSVISNIDIISELDKFKRAHDVQQAGMSQTTSDIYYTFFGMSGLYQKFLAKDIVQSIRQLQQSIGNIVSLIHEGLCVIVMTISIMAMYTYHSSGMMNPFVGEILIQYGIAALVSYIVLTLRRSHIIVIFLALILAIVGVIIIQRLLIANLALM